MYRAIYEGKWVTIEEFRRLAGSDYYAKRIFPHCPDCGQEVRPCADDILPNAGTRRVRPHFSHLPGQADPECQYVTESLTVRRFAAFSTGIEQDRQQQAKARRVFVTENGRVTQAGYWAGFLMARILGTKNLGPEYQFTENAEDMLKVGLIPPADHKHWRRKAVSWARPFMWLLMHDFPMQAPGSKVAVVSFNFKIPEGSALDDSGQWHGAPGCIERAFQNTKRNMTKSSALRYGVTEEVAYNLAQQATRWGKNRPFSDVRLERLHPESLFPKAAL